MQPQPASTQSAPAQVIDFRAAAKRQRRLRRDAGARTVLLSQRRQAVELRNRMAL